MADSNSRPTHIPSRHNTPKRLQRKFTTSFYISGIFCAFILVPVVLLAVFELSSRSQAIEFLRFELAKVRERIVENTRNAPQDSTSILGDSDLTGLENLLKDNLRLASELSIKGAQCYEKTVPVLVQATFAASTLQSQFARQNLLAAQRQQQITVLEEERAWFQEQAAIPVELAFLNKSIPDLQTAVENLEQVFVNDPLGAFSKSGTVANETIEGDRAKKIREPLARLSAALGIIAEEHRSAEDVKNLDRQIIQFLETSNLDEGINLRAPLNIRDATSLRTSLKNTLQKLVERKNEMQTVVGDAKSALADINSQLNRLNENLVEASDRVPFAGSFTRLTSCPGDIEFLVHESDDPTEGSGIEDRGVPKKSTCSLDSRLSQLLPIWSSLPVSCALSPLLTMPSALLYSLSVVLSGAIGSVFAAFYFRYPDVIARMFMGLVAGMVALFVIKGGKFLFVMDLGTASLENPYSGALAGILAGLFTERGFKLIEHLIDTGIDRLKSDTNGNASESEPGPAVETAPSTNNDNTSGAGKTQPNKPPASV